MAGINAHLKITGKDAFILNRSEAYIGVLIDDLVTKGTDEPYRMFTSRAEYRLLLRQDNADLRLTPRAFSLGLASEERMQRVVEKKANSDAIIKYFKSESISPAEINSFLESINSAPILQLVRMFNVLARPGVSISDLGLASVTANVFLSAYCKEDIEQAEILMKYEGYIQRESELADKISRLDNLVLDVDFNYQQLTSLSLEAREKLSKVKPSTLGQASRISGISPSDVSVLMVYIGR